MSITNLLARGFDPMPAGGQANALMQVQQLRAGQQRNALMQQQMQAAQAEQAQRAQEAQRNALMQQTRDAEISRLQGGGEFDPLALYRAGVPEKQIEFLANRQNLGRPEVARTEQRRGSDGSPETVMLDRFGGLVGNALPQAVKLDMQNLGGTVQPVNPYTQTAPLKRTQTPDSVASNAVAIRGQNMQNDRAREANSVQRSLLQQQQELKVDELKAKAADRDKAKAAGISSIENQLSVIDKAISHPGKSTATGLSSVTDPRNIIPGTDARNFRAVLDQIKGSAFLQAFESLKGGGAITEIEGQKAQSAMARLDTAQSDEEFDVALGELRDVMATGYERASGKKYATPSPKFKMPANPNAGGVVDWGSLK